MSSSASGNSERYGGLAKIQDIGTITVLHVDDEPDFAELVAIYLQQAHEALNVVTENSAEAGLQRLDTEQVDCVVSDYDMPGTDGLEFLEAVREEFPDLPFILFTGKGSEEIASEAISAGVTDYLQKGTGTDQYAVLANRIENVTRRHHIEQEVKRSFHAIETAREGIAFLDEDGTFIYTNQAYADTYGYDREDLIGRHWGTLYPDENVERAYEDLLPSIPEKGRWTGENVHVRKDGTRLIVDHALAYTDSGTLLCLIQDITEEKQAQRALEQERQRFELFVDAVEEYAIFALDPDGFVTSWNRGAERIKGYSEDEILGEHFSVFYPEAKVESGYPDELLERALADGTVEDRGWRVREDGSTFRAVVVITAVFDEDGQHRGFLKVTRDVSDQRKTRRALEIDQSFLKRALDVLDDVFYVLDPQDRIVHVTDRAVDVTGYTREELLSMSALELFAPDDRRRVQAAIEDALETGSAELEVDLVTNDGRTIPFEFRKRRLADEEGQVFLAGVARDISERKRRERQLKRQLAQFEHFGSVLSHDLRTPLEVARGRLELARETGDNEHLRAAETALDRLDELIEDLADVMREGELVSDVTPVELEDCLRSVWESLATDGATLTIDTGGTIRADETALKRLLENLLKNSLEHGGDDVSVTVGMLPDGFYLEDDGPGIPEDKRDRVFDVGYSLKADRDGLGLASVNQLVIAHGWQITATEAADGGVRFEITDVELAK